MTAMYLDFFTALLAAISAFLWAASARVSFQFGYDMDAHLSAAMKRASSLNATAASFAAAAAVTQAVKTALVGFQLIS